MIRLWILAAASLLLNPAVSMAQDYPSDDLLEELRSRLKSAVVDNEDCAPSCSGVFFPQLAIDGNRLHLDYRVSNAATVITALKIPENTEARALTVDGKSQAFSRQGEQLNVLIDKGNHRISIELQVDDKAQEIRYQPPQPRTPISFESKQWQLLGNQSDSPSKTLIIKRSNPDGVPKLQKTSDTVEQNLPKASFTAYPEIIRHLSLNPDGWHITTTVRRWAGSASLTLDYPLLKQEKVISDNLQQQDLAHIELPAQQHQIRFESRIESIRDLHFQAQPQGRWIETWKLETHPRYELDIKASDSLLERHAVGAQHFEPLPGEYLTIEVQSLQSSKSPNLTLLEASNRVEVNEQSARYHIKARIESGMSQRHGIKLPDNWIVEEVRIDQRVFAIKQDQDNVLHLPLGKGEQTLQLVARSDQGLDFIFSPQWPQWHMEGANLSTSIEIEPDRWIIFTASEAQGASVLIWPVIMIICLLSLTLSRFALMKNYPLSASALSLWVIMAILSGSGSFLLWLTLWFCGLLHLQKQESASDRKEKPLDIKIFQFLTPFVTLMLALSFYELSQSSFLEQPSMLIVGEDSTSHQLNWYADILRSSDPSKHQITLYSLPHWVYQTLMLALNIWLVIKMIGIIRWGWSIYRDRVLIFTEKSQEN